MVSLKNRSMKLVMAFAIILPSVLFAKGERIGGLEPFYSGFIKGEGSKAGFDSLNTRFVGNWPFGPSYAVAYDQARSLVFCGSGGGVYILDVSNPSNPQKVSEKIHTRGVVWNLFYDGANTRLYIADGQGGLEIWNIQDPANPYKLGYYFTPGYA
ncbi:MAG: hypothetical protein ACPL28_10680, partial [bacterium]